eukprot:g8392.t1
MCIQFVVSQIKTKRVLHSRRHVSVLCHSATSFVSSERTEAETYDFQSSRVLVETSMLAAVSAISQFLLGMLRLESYMYYILPFPLVLSSIRSGPIAGRKTLMATFFLMLVIMGPTRALAYVVLFGPVGLGLGHLWHARWPWWFTVPICSAATVVSLFGFLFLLSYLIQENVFKLVIFNVYSVIVSH